MIPWLGVRDAFPPVTKALRNQMGCWRPALISQPNGSSTHTHAAFSLVRRRRPAALVESRSTHGPLAPRAACSRSLRRTIRARRYTVTLDRSFLDVMHGCAEPRADHEGTWITPGMIEAYSRLARIGYAHSVEVWSGAELAGGLYGWRSVACSSGSRCSAERQTHKSCARTAHQTAGAMEFRTD